MNKVELGETYEDAVTGFQGLCTGLSQHLHGPDQVCLESLVAGEAQREWFVISRIKEVIDRMNAN